MYCYKCKKEIIVTGGLMNLAVWDNKHGVYYSRKISVIECPDPKCKELLGIGNFSHQKEIDYIKVDKKAQY